MLGNPRRMRNMTSNNRSEVFPNCFSGNLVPLNQAAAGSDGGLAERTFGTPVGACDVNFTTGAEYTGYLCLDCESHSARPISVELDPNGDPILAICTSCQHIFPPAGRGQAKRRGTFARCPLCSGPAISNRLNELERFEFSLPGLLASPHPVRTQPKLVPI